MKKSEKRLVDTVDLNILPGEYQINGCMTHATVNQLLAKTSVALQSEKMWHLNFHQVTKVDSSGIALMLAWMRMAQAKNIPLKFSHLPQAMLDLARVSGVESLLPIVL